jgi:DNA-directed RNA polymerase specialized sigma24 family protein
MTHGEGDHRSFLRQFLPHEGLLRAYLRAGTRDPNEAEELLQEVSALLWEKFDSYDPSRPFSAWALGFARLQILKSSRTRPSGSWRTPRSRAPRRPRNGAASCRTA